MKNNDTSVSALAVGLTVIFLIAVFLLAAGFFVWVILPIIFPSIDLGYWQCVLLVILARVLCSSYSFNSNSKNEVV